MLMAVHYNKKTGEIYGITKEEEHSRILNQSAFVQAEDAAYGIIRKAPKEIAEMAPGGKRFRIKDVLPDGTVEVESER